MLAEPGRTATVPLPSEGHGSRRNASALSVGQLTANQSAALLLVARDLLRQHKLLVPSVSEVLTAAGAGRSQSYHGKNEVILAMANVLSRPRGRPRTSPAPEPDTSGVALEVLRFVLDHPGSLAGGLQRRGYRNDFKRFVLELRQWHSRLGLQEFSDAIGISVHTIKEWGNEDTFAPKASGHGGRARRCEARKERLKRLVEILHQKPSGFGINRASWTQETLIIAYCQKHGESLCRATLASLIKATGFRWKRARRVLTSPDPEYREKVELVLSTIQNLKPNELFFFVDELGPVRVKRFGGRAFVPRHETPVVPQVQHHRGSITMAGALSATANKVTWMYGAAKDSRSMIDLIEVLYCQHPEPSVPI